MTTKCGSSKCDGVAIAKVYWPGSEPIPMCEPCASRARGVGDAMGFKVPVEPLTDDAPKCETCFGTGTMPGFAQGTFPCPTCRRDDALKLAVDVLKAGAR